VHIQDSYATPLPITEKFEPSEYFRTTGNPEAIANNLAEQFTATARAGRLAGIALFVVRWL
jgi:hypothetical protein